MAKATKTAVKKAAPAKRSAGKPAIKATVGKGSTSKKQDTGIKYSDKSGDQPELVPIFNALKKLLLPYVKGSIQLRGGEDGQISLVSNKPVVLKGKERPEWWFASALVQRGYVGFYYMPVKEKAAMKAVFKPELLKCLNGKSCFHIKKDDPEIYRQVEEALAKGYQIKKSEGWL